ncbi:hypothetical protein L6452_06715 [Arctium lappa]|uniref:Uncharacterized protein n=1 Tax=Arctium lappa TaxID=4217 RepID=A0ACB9EKH1_ARCLA|nr:hypothetical protein L6452_06715 [Arctium lappa]
MAERKPLGFRFRLPWLLQPALTSRHAIAPEPPRTTTQTSVASTPAQRPPFRPPGIAPAPVAPPPTLATPPPASPTRAQPRSASFQASVASSPPPVPAKSSAPKSAIAKTLDPVTNQPTKETQTTTRETPGTTVPLAAARTADDGETQPTKETRAATEMANPATQPTKETQTTRETPGTMVPLAATRTADDGETQPTKETQAATEMASPATQPTKETQTTTRETPGSTVPLAAARTADDGDTQPTKETRAATEMGSPATQPTKETLTTGGTKPTIQTATPATPPDSPPLRPRSPVNTQPLQTSSAPRSLSGLASRPTDKPSSSPSITASHNAPDAKRSQAADLAPDAKPKEIAKVKGTQTKSLNPNSMEKITKPIASARVSLHREIKDDVFKFIRKMTTNPSNRYMDEEPASVVTVAGENTGASMYLGLDVIQREGSSNEETTAMLNSNVQGVNNSMMFNSSVMERNPGVHVGFSRNLANRKDLEMEKRESMETNKAEANMTPQQTLVYDPTIGRCLEGVSMEACDLDADDDADKSGKSYEIEVV